VTFKRLNRRSFISRSASAGFSLFIPAEALKFLSERNAGFQFSDKLMDNSDIIPAPDDPRLWAEWRVALQGWRKRKRSILKYDGSSYLSAPFQWVTSDFSCCFVMVCDSDFYDPRKNEFKISSLIGRGKKEFGGYDSVVLWHAYPRIGLDARNQFDFYREMPKGLPGVKEAVRQFHQAGIKVFVDYNPWDTGTRREQKSDIDSLTGIIQAIDADGIFLDTMKDAPDFRAKLDRVREGIALEGEIALPLEYIQSHHMSWAQWFRDSNVPGVYRNKWFERHHMQHATDRWNADKSAQLQTAWMNGSGMLIWENVFGQLPGWSEKDKSVYRAMYSIQHRFANLFSGEDWTPLSEESNIKGVYISSWRGGGTTLFTLVNRNDSAAEGVLFAFRPEGKIRLFDLLKGEEVSNKIESGLIRVNGKIGKKGIGCFISADPDKIDSNFTEFLSRQKELFLRASEDTSVPVTRIVVTGTREIARIKNIPEGMVAVPAISTEIVVEYTFRETGGYGNIQEYLQLAAKHKLHTLCQVRRAAEIKPFAIDKTPVTNLQFKEFLDRSGYKPATGKNFLRHWINGRIPAGKEDHPVVYTDLVDARAYARWAGKRLVTEEEWQFAAQGPETLAYPWGNEMEEGRCNPNLDGETTSVKAFPAGASPFGCLDMCGNTWELTANEYNDGRTRFVMLKGGSCYKATGSEWYFDGGPQKNSFLAKMLLIWPGLDRCPTVGFRCAADL
jgi:Sulfatase-modifying factor enzyme 1